jgi:long-subunit fatty acid transport protein
MSPLYLALLWQSSLASPVDLYGFGGANIGRGGGGIAIVEDSTAAMLNPAGLSFIDRPELLLGAGLARMDFNKLPEVWWDTNRDGQINEFDPPLEVDPDPEPADGFTVAASSPVLDRYHVGAALFVPARQLTRFHTFDPSIPTYYQFENRPHRFALAMAASAELGNGVSVGGGLRFLLKAPLRLGFTLSSTVDGGAASGATIDDIVSVEADIHDIDLRIEPDWVPVFGLRWELGEANPNLEGLSLGLTGRGEGAMEIEVNLDGQLNITAENVGDFSPTAMAIFISSYVQVLDHYLPSQLAGGIGWQPTAALSIYADLQYTKWSGMKLNIAKITDLVLDATLIDLSGIEVSDGNPSSLNFNDTLSVKTGIEFTLPRKRLSDGVGTIQLTPRGGFGYEPTPLASQTPDTALLDSDRLIFAVGLGIEHTFQFAGNERVVVWDLYLQQQVLARGLFTRPTPDEPTAGYPVVDQGFPIGGSLTTAGLQAGYRY